MASNGEIDEVEHTSADKDNNQIENKGGGDSEDEFAGILEDSNTSPRDERVDNLEAVNYKVPTMEEYEKVDILQSSTDQAASPRGESPRRDSPRQQLPEQDQEDMQTESEEKSNHIHSNGTANNTISTSQETNQQLALQTPDASVPSPISAPIPSPISVSVPGPTPPTQEGDGDGEAKDVTEVPDTEQLLKARAEWDAVGTIQPAAGSVDDAKGKYGPASGQTPVISFNETLAYFQRFDMSQYKSKIKPTVQRTGWSAIKHFIIGPPKIKTELHEERDLVFAIAQCPFDDSEDIHQRVLQTIYKQLTGSTIDCPRYGTHWEQIGFQGNDPSTDLRACGFLGLMTLLHFVMDPERLALAKEIYKLSLHETQNFPFCVMSINMTRIALQSLREENLSRECNRRKQVLGVVNDFFAGVFLSLFLIWKQQHKTIKDSGFVLKDVETKARRNPKEVMQYLEDYLKNKKSPGPNSGEATNSETPVDFAGVHELDDEEEEEE